MTTIIAGTNRPNSHTLKLAKYYQKKTKSGRILSGPFVLSPGNRLLVLALGASHHFITGNLVIGL